VNDQHDGDDPRADDPRGAEPPADVPAADDPAADGSGDGTSLFDDEGSAGEEERPGFFARHKALTVLGALAIVLVLAVAAGAVYVNHVLFGDIDRINAFGSIDEKARPEPTDGEAINILLAGADNGDSSGLSVKQAMEDGTWSAGQYRSDTIMVLHIPADHSRAYVVSIPRDSYVRIYNETGKPTDKHKVNYAFSVYGPAGYVSTIEHLTDVRMDHLAIIDWDGFKDVVDTLGGVRLYVPQTVHDSEQKYTYEQGWHEYDGEHALKYVRSRYPLDEGDFDRNRRQQNFLRAMLDKMASTGALTDFPTFLSAAKTITSNLTIDDQWSNGDMRSLGWSMRGIRKDDVTFLSAPISKKHPFGDVPGDGSVVYLNKRGVNDLFSAMRADDMQTYVNDHPELTLPSETQVD
jgi:LCP family protein required for cell wall assembly